MPESTPPAIAHDPLRALLQAAVDAIVLIDERGRITAFSRSAEKLFGYRAAEVVGENVNVLMPEPYRGEHDGYIESYENTGKRRIIGIGREVVARRKDGSTFPIDLSVGEYATEGLRGFVGILRDITERKHQEALQRRNSEELRLIFEFAPTAMTTTDLQGHILRANRACAELLGRDIDALRGHRHVDLMHADDRPRAIAGLSLISDQGGEWRQELRYRCADGSELTVLHYSAAVTDGDGRPQQIISELVDRSALLAANREADALRERLMHASRIGQLGEMVSGIAHEVNQPLTAIANYASACRRLLQSGQATPAELATPLDRIAAQAERAGQVIRGLRTLARRQDSQRRPLDVNQLVREVLPLVEFEARQSGVRLRSWLGEKLPPVGGDAVQIQQVLLNLIRNAVEAVAAAGPGDIVDVVTVCNEAQRVEIQVADRGPGIAAEAVARLFEPFYTTKPQGMGLGLSICESIANAHGGELSYYCNEYGGATFALRLPAMVASQEDMR
ncbi:PAS domain-containing sensor histidine kinase [Solimonas terrae]|uniref:Sensor protein FixL n=1 Tax=Solimonas terrae TaxID=1396819 RepID=A0A6M2BLH9_9GAMM|nr:PAS domain S-box protein [Solimonas terrae]NGY03200.1 PAS domain S-box protein [Solimonas terrae]